MTEVDIRTRFTIIQPCCGLSFFFPPAHTHTHRPVCKCFDLARRNVCFMHQATSHWFVLLVFFSFSFKLDEFAFCVAIRLRRTLPRYWRLSLSLSARLANRLSTKTTWSWRKETSTSTPSWPGRPTPTHTSLTSTPTMIINPYSRSERTPPTSPLCSVSRFLTPCMGWSHPDTLRQLEHKQWRARLPTEGNNGVLSGALGYTWKTFLRLIQKLMTGILFQRGPKEG